LQATGKKNFAETKKNAKKAMTARKAQKSTFLTI